MFTKNTKKIGLLGNGFNIKKPETIIISNSSNIGLQEDHQGAYIIIHKNFF